jgi:hypothetical protein
MDTDMLRDESTAPADIPGLVAQARAAYQQNRIKECLALTKAALLVDPGNTAALEMQSAVRFDMQRDLSDARALIEESRNKPEAQKYRKAAEIILLKALYLDPDSEGAKTLLSSIRLASEGPMPSTTIPEPSVSFASSVVVPPPAPPKPTPPPPVPVPVPPVVYTPPVVHEPAPIVYKEPYREPVVQEAPKVFTPPVEPEPQVSYEPPAVFADSSSQEETAAFVASASRQDTITSSNVMEPETSSSSSEPIPFTVGTSYIEKPGYMKSGKKKSQSNYMVPLAIVAVLIVAAGLLMFRQKLGTDASASTATENNSKTSEQIASPQGSFTQSSSAVSPLNTSSTAGTTGSATKSTLVAANTPPALPVVPSSNTTSAANSNSNSKTNTTSTPATGSLAVSCAIAAEIYIGGKQVGSTPTTLQLPAGNQTIEYRHGDLKTVVNHVIKAKETTTALVVFETTVQVTARPWATVSIEGSPRLPLGETPLTDVRLPVGSVLTFENPNFPSKSHKIAPDDKSIQMVFP